MTAEITSIQNVFHSSIIQQCKIYPWEKEFHTIITYWLCKNDTIQIYKVINSKPVLIKEVNKVFQNYSYEVTDVKISGLKIFESLDKVVLFGRDVFSILPLTKVLNSADLQIDSKDIGATVTSCTYWITDIEITLEKCYILTCYNELLTYDIETFKLLNRVKQNQVNSISYKGYLRMNNEELIVVSPSVLNGCLVWKYDTNNDEVIDLYKLADDSHYGIIFDACIDNEYKYLLTCSDDRSINLYDFKTGKMLQKLYGHVSRVWKVKFVYNNDGTGLWGILSCSEDCKFITWKFDEDKSTLSKHNAHEVSHIKNCWNIDYYDNQVLSCGNDGRVKLTFIDIYDKLTANTIPLGLYKKEMIKDMIRIADDDYVLLSNNGNMLYNINTKYTEESTIDSIAVESVFKIIDIEYDNMFLTLDKKNYMTLYQKTSKVNKIKEFMITDVSKILSLSLVGKVDDRHFEFVVDSPNINDNFVLYSFDVEKLEITKLHEYSKVVSHQKQPLTVTCGAYTKTDDSLLIGTLNGKLIHYNGAELITYKSYSENNDAVVGISTTPLKSEKDKDLLLVSSRSQYSLVATNLKTQTLSNISSSKIESIKYSSDGGIIITTNKDGCFIQFNESKNMIMNQYKLKNDIKASFAGKDNWFAYVFLKDNKSYINIETIRDEKDLLIHEGTHGRETRCITILDETDDVIIFVTGSEDTTLKLHTFDKSNDLSGNSQSMTYRGHVSGLQTSGKIQLKSGKQLFLSTSAKEELFIWSYNKVKDVKRNNMKSYLNLETKLPTTRDLKRGKGIVNNVELRVTCFCFDTNNNVLYTCYSNSMIRSWDFTFDATTNEYNITLKNEIFYKQCSIFDCTLNNDYLILGTSEGILVSYKINGSKLEMKDCLNAHQNGIMSIDKMRENYLITGGDDNAISLVKIDNSTGIFEIINQITNVSNSAITNVKKVTDDLFLFTSIDQLVGTYFIDYDKKSMKEMKKFYTNIADTQSVDITEDFVFLGGLGLSIYRDLI